MLLYIKKLKFIFFACSFIIGLLIFFIGCQKKSSIDSLSQKIKKEVMNYLYPQVVDSIQIISIDTLSSLSYAILAADMLQKMKWEMETEYRQVLQQHQDTFNQWEADLSEIEYYMSFFEAKKADETTPANDVLLFWVSGRYYYQGQADVFEILLDREYKQYDLDVFNHNLLKE